MLMRTDPFRDLDRFAQQLMGTAARPAGMPMDAWREGDEFVIELDLPGVQPDAIDLDVERNVLTVRAERPPRPEQQDLVTAERPRGVFSRQLVLGETLDTEQLQARYDAGVLTLRVPIAAKAKSRKISIESGSGGQSISSHQEPIEVAERSSKREPAHAGA